MIKISIISPVYNGDRFIEFCIQNVIDQNCPDIEHIIVDGGSTDKTVEIIEFYATKYSHIRWVSEKDKGQSDALNKGILMAKGEIIATLNVDDYYEPNVLKKAARFFEKLPEPTLLVGNCNVWKDGDILVRVSKPKGLSLTSILLGSLYPENPSAYFYHKSLHEKIGFYDVDKHYEMDLDFLLKAVQVAQVKYVDETWGNFRRFHGTKTVNDIKSGQLKYRVEALMETYRKQLPLYQQQAIGIGYLLRKKWREIKAGVKNLKSK